MTHFDNAITAALAAVGNAAARPATYTRDGVDVAITAIAGSTASEAVDDTGAVTAGRVRDWLTQAAPLTALGMGTPERGDTFTVAGEVYLVTQRGDECWRYIDPAKVWLRVHTRSTSQTVVQ